VSTAYAAGAWGEFGTAVATASAALLGLLFVALLNIWVLPVEIQRWRTRWCP
jgi:hypothetical protein